MHLRSLLLWAALGAIGGGLSAQEGGLASQLPAGTTAYFEIPDVQALVGGSSNSSFGRIFREPEVQDFLGPGIDRLNQAWSHLRSMAAQEGVPPALLHWEALSSVEFGFCLLPGEQVEPSVCMAVAVGVRAASCTMPVPRRMRSVCAPIQASGTRQSEP